MNALWQFDQRILFSSSAVKEESSKLSSKRNRLRPLDNAILDFHDYRHLLPTDCWRYIFSFLSCKDLYTLEATCKFFHSTLREPANDMVWHQIAEAENAIHYRRMKRHSQHQSKGGIAFLFSLLHHHPLRLTPRHLTWRSLCLDFFRFNVNTNLTAENVRLFFLSQDSEQVQGLEYVYFKDMECQKVKWSGILDSVTWEKDDLGKIWILDLIIDLPILSVDIYQRCSLCQLYISDSNFCASAASQKIKPEELKNGDRLEFFGRLHKGPTQSFPGKALPDLLLNKFFYPSFQVTEGAVLSLEASKEVLKIPQPVFWKFFFWLLLPIFWCFSENFRKYLFVFEYALFALPGFLASNWKRRLSICMLLWVVALFFYDHWQFYFLHFIKTFSFFFWLIVGQIFFLKKFAVTNRPFLQNWFLIPTLLFIAIWRENINFSEFFVSMVWLGFWVLFGIDFWIFKAPKVRIMFLWGFGIWYFLNLYWTALPLLFYLYIVIRVGSPRYFPYVGLFHLSKFCHDAFLSEKFRNQWLRFWEFPFAKIQWSFADFKKWFLLKPNVIKQR